jgi:hypothetical protein
VQKDYLLNPFCGKSLQETIEKVKVCYFFLQNITFSGSNGLGSQNMRSGLGTAPPPYRSFSLTICISVDTLGSLICC